MEIRKTRQSVSMVIFIAGGIWLIGLAAPDTVSILGRRICMQERMVFQNGGGEAR
jgi:hypothetical protein